MKIQYTLEHLEKIILCIFFKRSVGNYVKNMACVCVLIFPFPFFDETTFLCMYLQVFIKCHNSFKEHKKQRFQVGPSYKNNYCLHDVCVPLVQPCIERALASRNNIKLCLFMAYLRNVLYLRD